MLVLLLTLLLLAPSTTPLPGDEAAVLAIVTGVTDAMRTADAAAIRNAFHPDAQIYTVGPNRNGDVAVRVTSAAEFAAIIGAPRDEVYDERLGDAEVRIDGDLATVWIPFAFYLDDSFSHCGINAIQLARLDARWQIIHIADTRRRSACDPSIP